MANINYIISPYFSRNTILVANCCHKCYLETDDVLITAVNIDFLRNNDPKQYHILKGSLTQLVDKLEVNRIQNDIRTNGRTEAFLEQDKVRSIKKDNIEGLFNFHKIRKKLYKRKLVLRKYNNIHRKYNISKNGGNNNFKTKYKLNKPSTNSKIVKYSAKMFIQAEDNSQVDKNEWEMYVKKEKDEEELEYMSPIISRHRSIGHSNHEPPLNIEEKCFKQSVSKWIPPLSPHNLIEERFYHDPWALLVVTIFLNRTACSLALPYIEKFFEDFKGPYDVLKTESETLEPYFIKLGLVRTRATQVWRMSQDFVLKNWSDVKELYGVGKYAEDAYRIFHLGDFGVQPTDRYLKIYKGWYQMMQKQKEQGLVESNSQVYLEDYYIEPEDEDRRDDDESEYIH